MLLPANGSNRTLCTPVHSTASCALTVRMTRVSIATAAPACAGAGAGSPLVMDGTPHVPEIVSKMAGWNWLPDTHRFMATSFMPMATTGVYDRSLTTDDGAVTKR